MQRGSKLNLKKSRLLTEDQLARNMTQHVLYKKYSRIITKVDEGKVVGGICKEWRNFDQFVADITEVIGLPPDNKHYLKRKNSKMEYNKDNVYWHEQRSHSVTPIAKNAVDRLKQNSLTENSDLPEETVVLTQIERLSANTSDNSDSKLIVPKMPKLKPSKHYLFVRYKGMMERCYKTTHERYDKYGGRVDPVTGTPNPVTVCDEWHDFDTFVRDIESVIGTPPVPSARLTLIDPEGHYEKSNVYWTKSMYVRSKNGMTVKVSYEFINKDLPFDEDDEYLNEQLLNKLTKLSEDHNSTLKYITSGHRVDKKIIDDNRLKMSNTNTLPAK